MTKPKNSYIDKTKQNQTVIKLKKPKLWQNSRTLTMIKQYKKKLWQNLKYQIVTKLKNLNCAKLKKLNCDNSKTQIVIVIKMTVVTEAVILTSFSENTLTPWQPTTLRAAIRNSCDVFISVCATAKQPLPEVVETSDQIVSS